MCIYSYTRKYKICLTGSLSGCLFQNAPLGEAHSSKQSRRQQKFFKTCYLLSSTVHRATEDSVENLESRFIDFSRPFKNNNFGIQLFVHFKTEFLTDFLFCRLVKGNAED